MRQIAATGAASISTFLPLLFLGCLTSLSAKPMQRQVVLKGPLSFIDLDDELNMEYVISDCYKHCWAKFLPSYEECMENDACAECYSYCPFSPYKNVDIISSTTTTTTTTTTTPAPTTTLSSTTTIIDRQQHLSKINKSIQETWSLHTVSMMQQDSLVLVDIAWEALNTPSQCLISWEVSGGGLMGNLLTESSNVQLSLWPDTKYRVKVTCKNKFTGFMTRSLPLSIDTSEAINAHDHLSKHKANSSNVEVTSTHASGSKFYAPITKNTLEHNSNAIATEADNAAVLPYDEHDEEQDQSAETLNQHTNFIFNWHTKNNDISAIEPVQKPDINMLTIAALSDIQKPLLFGLTAGIILLTLVLAMYICLMKSYQQLHDKTALIDDKKVHAILTTMSPAALAAARANTKLAKRKTNEGQQRDGGETILMVDAATSLAYQRGSDDDEAEAKQAFERVAGEVCSNPAICSRNALKV
ncbi:uncharacterized protein [Eurosta solidaginis]|uniref:uncharacterized protein n=1 Tax=Eurosta solidaginis TaxID=178769 RepID=UPI00353158F5